VLTEGKIGRYVAHGREFWPLAQASYEREDKLTESSWEDNVYIVTLQLRRQNMQKKPREITAQKASCFMPDFRQKMP